MSFKWNPLIPFVLFLLNLGVAQSLGAKDKKFSGISSNLSQKGKRNQIGYLSLNANLDKRKPVGSLSAGGWALSGETLVGEYNRQWVVAYSFDGKSLKKSPRWWIRNHEGLTASPLFYNDQVFLSFRNGEVYCVDQVKGSVLWKVLLPSHVDHPFLAHNGKLYGVTAHSKVYSLEASSGEINWVYDLSSPQVDLKLARGAQPLIRNQVLYVGFNSGEFTALNIETGALLWRVAPASSSGAAFQGVVGEITGMHNQGVVFSRYGGQVAQYQHRGSDLPDLKWLHTSPHYILTSQYRDRSYFLGTYSGEVVSIDSATGDVNWKTNLGFPVTHLTVSEQKIYGGGSNGKIFAIDRLRGEVEWLDDLGNSLISRATVQDNKVYFITRNHNLYAYRN